MFGQIDFNAELFQLRRDLVDLIAIARVQEEIVEVFLLRIDREKRRPQAVLEFDRDSVAANLAAGVVEHLRQQPIGGRGIETHEALVRQPARPAVVLGVGEERLNLGGRQRLPLLHGLVLDRLDRGAQPVDGDGAGVVHAGKDVGHHARPARDELLPRLARLDVAGAFLADRFDADQQGRGILCGRASGADGPEQSANHPAWYRSVHRVPRVVLENADD
jgi:hypothetical protein